jgi:hypothetical protein
MQEPMTVIHVLTRCLKLAILREEIWPNRTEIQEELFGNLDEAAPPDDNVHY